MDKYTIEGWMDNKDGISHHKDIVSIPIFENRQEEVPLVTIAIPTYNRISTLKYALKSALNQDYNNYEIIVVDNNPESNDDTERFLLQYSSNSRLSYYKNRENIGLYGNWNRCFELSRTKWVTLLHDDDYYFPEYLSVMMAYLEKYPEIDALSSKHIWWKEDEHDNQIDIIERDRVRTPSGITSIPKRAFLLTHYVGPVGIIFKKSCFLELGGFNEIYYPISDYIFDWRYFLKYNFKSLNTVTHHYRIGKNVSQKPETIERQETLGRMIRTDYIKTHNVGCFTQKLVDSYYLQQMQYLARRYPLYKIEENCHISKWNPYRIVSMKYISWYLKYREHFLSKFNRI